MLQSASYYFGANPFHYSFYVLWYLLVCCILGGCQVCAHCTIQTIKFQKQTVSSQYLVKCKYLIKKVKSFWIICLKSMSSQVSWLPSQSRVFYLLVKQVLSPQELLLESDSSQASAVHKHQSISMSALHMSTTLFFKQADKSNKNKKKSFFSIPNI